MGRNGGWFASVKKTLSPNSKKKAQKLNKTNKQKNHMDAVSSSIGGGMVLPQISQLEEVTSTQQETEQIKRTNTVEFPTTTAAEPAVTTAQAAAEVVRLTSVARFAGKSKEEVAAIEIQTAFRGYLARRAFRGLHGLVRYKSLIEGPAVRRQTANTLRYLQILTRVQSQIHSRRIKMLEEDEALQRQLLQKQAKELENLQMLESWDDSLQSKEQTEAKLLSKYEAAMKRERALAYAFSHQPWKNSSRSRNPVFMDPSNPHWGWSWLERRMSARPWEIRSVNEKGLNDDRSSIKSGGHFSITGGEISRAYAQHLLNSKNLSPTSNQKPINATFTGHISPPMLSSKVASSSPEVPRKTKPTSPRLGKPRGLDNFLNTMPSSETVRHRRHTIAGSSVRDDESQGSSTAVPSYMVPTESAKAKSSPVPIPLGLERIRTPEKAPAAGSAKKQLSFQVSPRSRRCSGPPAVGSSSISERNVKNGG